MTLILGATNVQLAMIKIIFNVDADDWHGHSSESLWAKSTDTPGEFILENAPFFARDVSFGDRVAAQYRDGTHFFKQVVARSGHSTYRVIPQRVEGLLVPMDATLHLLMNEGCRFEKGKVGNMPFVVVDVPKDSSADRCYGALKSADAADMLHFEVAHDGHPSTEVEQSKPT